MENLSSKKIKNKGERKLKKTTAGRGKEEEEEEKEKKFNLGFYVEREVTDGREPGKNAEMPTFEFIVFLI